MDYYIKYRKEPEAHISKVDRQIGGLDWYRRVNLLCQAFEIQFLWVFLWVRKQTFTVSWKSLLKELQKN